MFGATVEQRHQDITQNTPQTSELASLIFLASIRLSECTVGTQRIRRIRRAATRTKGHIWVPGVLGLLPEAKQKLTNGQSKISYAEVGHAKLIKQNPTFENYDSEFAL